MTTIRQLLTGRGTGLPLFLAWCGVELLHCAATQIFIWDSIFKRNVLPSKWVVYSVLAPYVLIQAVLITPHILRRFGWAAVAILFNAVPYHSSHGGYLSFWDWPLFMTAFVRAAFLIGVRQRVWVWSLAVVLFYPVWKSFSPYANAAYQAFASTVTWTSWLRFEMIYHNIVPNVVLGLTAAFLMPPVESKQSQRVE
jgi:hypothetical protein